ncbi:lipopolysaccharide assembly protein LapB [Prochlorococcus sp. MIT 1306]|uniref:tetratricopeptide repeat protein n=1 Tax=Prochlorococcus sp. MIT 1306 TaxID=1799667 RepID=UPI0007BC188B|nr:tetratricopeptide repeat protein [Prochlorococcus sp. MIT 1306]KZR66558.1 TPR repeat-containing protein YrrB [Prochlorococcus sp. MIT 1306]
MNEQEVIEKLETAIVLHKQGNLDKAEEIYNLVLAADDNNFYALNCLGCLKRIKKEYEQAIFFLKRATQLQPSNPDSCYNLGNAYKDASFWKEAINCYETSLSLAPHNPEVLLNLGNALKECGQLREAIINYQQAINMNPDDANIYLNLGNALKEQNFVDEAIENYRKAIDLKPDFSDAYLNLGIVLQERGEFDAARSALLESLKLMPDSTLAFFYLFQNYDHSQFTDTTSKDYLSLLSRQILKVLALEKCICFGDCHVMAFNDIEGFEVIHVGAATAYNLTESRTSTGGRNKILARLNVARPESDAVLLSFGEVDIRANILKYCIRFDRNIEEVCFDLVSRYFSFVDEILLMGFRVIIYGPWGSGCDQDNQGSMQERYYSSRCLELLLSQKSAENDVPYFSLSSVFSDHIAKTTRSDFFDDSGMHFYGHPDEIPLEIKSMILSRMLESLNQCEEACGRLAPPTLRESSLIKSDVLCLLDIFVSSIPYFCLLGQIPSAEERLRILSQAKKSIVLDFAACLNLMSCTLQLEFIAGDFSLDGWEVWGLCSESAKEEGKLTYSKISSESESTVKVKASFSENSMLRYLILNFPEGCLAGLSNFDVTGKTFVFPD